jgi:hypothetical protein
MKYRVKRQDDLGNVFTVPHDGVWYENLADAIAVKRKLEHPKHKQDYWIEDEEGRVIYLLYFVLLRSSLDYRGIDLTSIHACAFWMSSGESFPARFTALDTL